MDDHSTNSDSYKELLARCEELQDEKNRRLKGELVVVEAKKLVDEELARQKFIQGFVGDALKIHNASELVELTLEVIIEAFECETAALLVLNDDKETVSVVAQFDGERLKTKLSCPVILKDEQTSFLIQDNDEVLKAWEPLGIVNGIVCNFLGVTETVAGAIIAGTTAEEIGTFPSFEEQHLSSFSVLVSLATSFYNNIVLDQEVKENLAQLEENKELLEQRVEERTKELSEVAESLDDKNTMLEGLSNKLSKYLSPQIYDSIFSGEQEVALETKRKKLTIFFSDIKNFTATTDDLEPEDINYLVNDYLTEMSKIALRHGATIDKFIGDAIVIFFGDPTTLGVQEDALACLRMAIEMQRHMVGLRAKWTEMGYSRPFQVRVGINTGFCNVGNFGSEERMDYTIIGGEVNLAARLEGEADPDGITVSYETYALIKDFVDAEACEPISVKGIHRKINPYRLIGIYKNIDEQNRFVRAEHDGMKLFLDFDKLDVNTRPKAIEKMESALKRLHEER